MRISDWSSDVCSSDLASFRLEPTFGNFKYFNCFLQRHNDDPIVITEYIIARLNQQVAVYPLYVNRYLVIHNHKAAEGFDRITESTKCGESHIKDRKSVV